MAPVIVFGPTGAVGSAAARTAQQLGTTVYLAMRDPTKPIPGLSAEKESEGGFERVQADFSQPDTISTAVAQSKAKHAFIYTDLTSSDHMRASFTALKEAGIEFVVLLSSFGIQEDVRNVSPEDHIAYVHAQAEISLQEIFGANSYVAVRPAFYASNTLWWKAPIQTGHVKLAWPAAAFDWISPEDIGGVCGTILAHRAQGTDLSLAEPYVNLVGAEKMGVGDAVKTIGKVLGKEVNVSEVGENGALDSLVNESGLPEPIARSVLGFCQNAANGQSFMDSPRYGPAVGNIEKYLGRPATRLHEWVEANPEKFSA
ncbi:NmrA-like family protein [Aspergillus costaricaensis CBS 115574]|uniref:NmrA-like family protein n=1 Tax=Aspergillus costaricaensis CBS 115574 TaxID=1448317 RepID=A0ACD1IIM9_9EURO|nr:NmrA-like family protein [Aspergillus costaricaensis CBS 115574]RAK90463.1 NmrA-like family protein [Aspergillus costaricaensis CBS 115574]